jgi:RimJ/RimL family protein N-acetyltransferase
MIFPDKQIILKDGRTATLRAPELRDAQALIDLLKTVNTETHFLSSYPEEITLSQEDEERWIEGHRESPLIYDILCEMDGEIIGSCNLLRKKQIKIPIELPSASPSSKTIGISASALPCFGR